MTLPRAALLPLFLTSALLLAQPPGQSIAPAPPDPAIAAALSEISSDRIHATIEKLVSFNNRNTLSSNDTDLPANTGVLAAAAWIESEFNQISADCNHCLAVHRDDFIEPADSSPRSRVTHPTRIVNVYAVLRGSDPAQAPRMVLVTGHYDSRNSSPLDTRAPAPGANDDASGTAVSLECARVLSKLRLPATLVFAAVAGEEQGLHGSAHLARFAREQNWQLEAVLNNDIVGGDTTPADTLQDFSAVRVFSEGVPASATPEQLRTIESLGAESDSASRQLARAIADIAATYFQRTSRHGPSSGKGYHSSHILTSTPFHPVLIFRRDRFLRGGDHTSFNQQGFPAVRLTEWRENFDHQHQNVRMENGTQYGDLLQYVDPDYTANVARLNAATLASLAAAPGPPEDVRILTRDLDNNTELTWHAPAGAPAGTTYEVLWRTTDQPTWTTVAPASGTSLKLSISKDNVVFAVRSADPQGHRSPAVLPMPTR